MWTVFCTPQDYSAVWARDGLRRRGFTPVELVTTESLAFASAWEHRVGLDGAHFKVALQDTGFCAHPGAAAFSIA
jgi:hypothetical protein